MPYGRGHKLSLETCQERVSFVSPNIKILKYESARIPVKCLCTICGHEWLEPSKNLYRGSNCPICFKRKNNTRTHESFLKEMHNINPDLILLDKYINSKSVMRCKCNKCGYEWKSTPSNLLFRGQCQKCANKRIADLQRKTTKQFIEELRQINNTVEVLGEYMGAKEKIKCRCTKCGTIWTTTPTTLLSNSGCPDCGRKRIRYKQLKPHNTFVAEMKDRNPEIDVISEYRGAKELVTLRCTICGEIWQCYATNAVSHACGCPACRSSHGEKAISAYLRNAHIDYLPQHRFNDLVGVGGTMLSYDFYLPTYNTLIEYQGEYHDGSVVWQSEEQLSKQIEHDNRKRQYAIDNSFKLIEIWYYDFNKIKNILDSKLHIQKNISSVA